MKKTMNNFFRLKPLSILCLSLASLTIFSACRDDIADAPDREHQEAQVKATEDYIGKVNIAIEADVVPMSDQEGRGLNYSLIDRSQKIAVDGNTVPSGVDYTDEVAPRMALKEGDTQLGFLIFYHENGTVVRKSVEFKVIEGVQKKDGSIDPRAKNRVQYVGDIDFPTGVTLKEEFENSSNNAISSPYNAQRISPKNITKNSRWHVMAMIGYQDATKYFANSDADTHNRLLINSDNGMRYRLNPSESFDGAWNLGDSITLNTPCASAWMPLYITKAPKNVAVTGINLDLHFKPQGVILQYDLASMANDTQDIRRVGLVSNVLDFKGYYDLNSESIKKAFNSKDGDNYGLPTWVPDEPNMEDLSMYYTPAHKASLTSGDRVFPWDMPTLSSNRTSTQENWSTPGTNKWEVEKASVLSIYPLGKSDENSTERPSSYPWLNAQKLWTFYDLGGSMGYNRKASYARKILYFWGMPRTEARMPHANKRATYLFASSYSLMTDEDAWDAPNGFDTDGFTKLVKLANQYANDLIDREKKINATTDPDTKQKLQADYQKYKNYYENRDGWNTVRNYFPGPTFPAARGAINKAIEYTRAANDTKITPRTQPLMVLHQTNRTFTERKVYHAQAVIRPDLMLSEVIYQKHGGQNYSLLEVYNTTVEPVDLSQYGIVRLIPSNNGSHLAFRGPNGQPVESLSQALVLPLTALKGGTDPFADSKLSSLKQSGHNYDDAANRARPVYYKWATSKRTDEGLWSGVWVYSRLEDASTTHPDRSQYLMKGQSILLGASGYINSPVTKKEDYYTVELIDSNGWFKSLRELLEANMNKGYLRYAYAYADGEKKSGNTFGAGTLDYEPGDAFALIKKTSTGWQIIDATGPVGPKHLAFAGTYASFKEEMDKHKNSESFSQQRLDGVNYPFIAPFRTKRLYDSKWSDDWSIKTNINEFTPGRRFGYNGQDALFGSWNYQIKRTPIDENFSTYQNARPTKGH